MKDDLKQSALHYHKHPTPGKIAVTPTKPLATQRDLALAYSPGVAAACEAIVEDENEVANMTLRSNLVAVITNGTAVLGLGNIGPLASKPVMEGKGVLFKKFAGLDVFDIEVSENDPDKLVDIIASLEPTFGGINLEDIKAPECFEVEQKLRKRMKIPVFHDDQHGTAIISASAVLNGLDLVDKDISKVKLACSGAGAAAIACLDLMVNLGLKKENITVCDAKGVVYKGREGINDPFKQKYARETSARTLEDAIDGADIFLGLSVGNVLKAKSLKKMAKSPIILALANPTPEVDPNEARKERPDAIIATGRSDFPNQVNNVLCFPFIFRGALDVGATTINDEMKMACVRALAALAKAEASDVVVSAYGDEDLQFGPEYIIPKPFDPRLIVELSSAVAKAAMDTGVATRPIEDFSAYRQKLAEFVFKSGMVMRPILDRAAQDKKRLVFADGEEFRVLRAIQIIVDEGLAFPIIIGRADVVKHRIKSLGLRLKKDKDYELVDPQDDPRYKDYWTTYHSLLERQGVSPDYAKIVVRTNTSVIAALMVHKKQADAMLAGPIGRFRDHLNSIIPVLDLKPGVRSAASMTALITGKGNFFFCDPYVNYDPSSTELAEIAIQAAEHVRSFGLEPKVALLCHSNFGSTSFPTAQKMQQTLQHIRQLAPELEVEGEMHADAALEEKLREQVFPKSQLKGQANLLVMPNMDAANIAFNLSKCIGEGQSIGPILLGLDLPAHIITSSASVRSIVNMAAIAVVEAQLKIQNNGAFRNPNQSQVA